jgi:glutamine cyclotransferase
MRKNISVLIIIFIVASVFDFRFVVDTLLADDNKQLYTYRIIKKYPHSAEDFTEGFIYENGIIYESTGLYGKSKMKKYKLGSTEPIKEYGLPVMYFGEGAVVLQDRVYQLTWKSRVGFIYNKNLELIGNFNYKTRGWGLTTNGKSLIMSDGTNKLYFLDPKTLKEEKIVEIYENEAPVVNINEMEYLNGKIYANIFMTDFIAIINPESGKVEGWIDLTGILEKENISTPVDVLNGIAYNTDSKRILITGKYWPYIYEIDLIEKK